MDDEFDNGLDSDFDAPESLEPDTYEPPMDVDSFMDDVPDAPDCDFGEFEDSFDNGLDIDSIMDEAALDVEPAPEMIEDNSEIPEVPWENVAEDISEIPEIPEEAVAEDIPEIPEIPEEAVAEDISEIPEISEEAVAEDIPEIPEIPEENVVEDIPGIPEIPEENVVEDIPEIPEISEETVAEDVPEISEVPADEVAEDVTITPEETIEAVGEDISLFEEETTAEYPPDLEEEVSEEDLQDQAVSETEDFTGSDVLPEMDDDSQLCENTDLLEEISGETLSENPTMEVIEEIPVVIDGPEPEGLVADEIMADSQDNSEPMDVAENEQDSDTVESSETEEITESGDSIEENEQPEQDEFTDTDGFPMFESESLEEQNVAAEFPLEIASEISQEEQLESGTDSDMNNSDVPGGGGPPPTPPNGPGGGGPPPTPPNDPNGGGNPPNIPPDVVDDSTYSGSGSAYDAMFDYIDQHGYGQQDYEIYSKDPEWQRLNNDLLVELGREPIDYSALDENPAEPVEFAAMPAQNAMAEYLGSHNYGREDYEIYSKDPEWQRLNNDLLVEMGEEPIEYPTTPDEAAEASIFGPKPAQNAMADYLSEHNYGREDYEIYSKDPEWQRLNNDLLVEMGEEPIEYPTTPDEAAEASIFGPKPAQNAMADYLSEHNYGREDYEIYSKDPEWQRLNNDLLVEMGEEPIDYSASLDQGTERIYDDFEKTILEANKDFYESGSFYVQGVNELGYTGTCGETSMANTINRVLGTNEFTENKVLNVAVQEGLCDTDSFPDGGGTTTKQFMDLYEKMNEQCGGQLDVQCFDYENVLPMEAVAQKLEEGCTINVAVDANTLWDLSDPMGSPFPETRATDHWITVTGVHRGDNGIIQGFDIVDSGGGVNYVDVDKYQAMCYGTEDLNLTDPTCIVVKKK